MNVAVVTGMPVGIVRQQMRSLRDRKAADHPERRLEHRREPSEAALAHDLVDRGDRARRAALDREPHHARAEHGDEERDAGQYDRHGNSGSGTRRTSRRTPRVYRNARPPLRDTYIMRAIVSGFLSLTMSAIVSTTVTLPSFFHQCLSAVRLASDLARLVQDRHRALAAVLVDLALVDHDEGRPVRVRVQRNDATRRDLHVAIAKPALWQVDRLLREIDRRQFHAR